MERNKDKHLDIPAESNREKHINFLEAEERTAAGETSDADRFGSNEEDRKRQEEWNKGLAEGREARNKKERG